MIEHVYRRAQAAESVDSVLVATDDTRIQEAVTRFGGEALLTVGDHQSGTDRLAEAVRDLKFDLVVNLQADEPLVNPMAIDLALQALSNNPKLLMSTIRCPIETPDELENPNVVKVTVDTEGFALYFSRSPIPFSRSVGLETPHGAYRHVGLYAYRRKFLLHLASLKPTQLEQTEKLEQLRALEHGYRIQTVEIKQEPIGVDTQQDLDRVRRIFSAGAS